MHDTILALELALLRPEVRRSSKALRFFWQMIFLKLVAQGRYCISRNK